MVDAPRPAPDLEPGTGAPRVRVFLGSPADVRPERAAAVATLTRLATRFQGRLELVPVLWEREPLLASEGFQEGIVGRLRPSQAEVAVFVLWARLGTPLSEAFRLPDGTRPTGTEWEFLDALAGHRARGEPAILVYRKVVEPVLGLNEPPERLESQRRDWQAVGAFFERHFRHAEDRSFIGAYHSFRTVAELESMLEDHLGALLAERVDGPGAAGVAGNPYRGLRAFEADDARLFFGRRRAVEAVLRALRSQVQARSAFVLVVGDSGCGKSSLLGAGVLPRLSDPRSVEPGLPPGAGARVARLRPLAGADPMRLLAEALRHPDALPALDRVGSVADLAAALGSGAEAAVGLVRSALAQEGGVAGREGGDSRPAPARLVLLVDPLEDLLASARGPGATGGALLITLAALARSGEVWLLGALRSDAYAALSSAPELVALKGTQGHVDLEAPAADELAEMIRLPARAAGLAFGRSARTGEALDDRLLLEAGRCGRDVLPLLGYALETLADSARLRPGPRPELSFEEFEALGGLEGCLSARAEAAWQRLGEPERAAFPVLLRALVNLPAGPAGAPSLRLAPRAEFDAIPAAGPVIAALLHERLAVTQPVGGVPCLRFAHEALLRAWPPAALQVERERELLGRHAWLRTRAADWVARGRSHVGLLSDPEELADARRLQASAFPLSADEGQLLAGSARAAAQRRLRSWAVAAVVVLGLGAALAGFLGWGRSARLSVLARPGAGVAVDGVARGTTPLSDLALSAGRHALRLEAEGFAPLEEALDLGRATHTSLERVLVPLDAGDERALARLAESIGHTLGATRITRSRASPSGSVPLVLLPRGPLLEPPTRVRLWAANPERGYTLALQTQDEHADATPALALPALQDEVELALPQAPAVSLRPGGSYRLVVRDAEGAEMGSATWRLLTAPEADALRADLAGGARTVAESLGREHPTTVLLEAQVLLSHGLASEAYALLARSGAAGSGPAALRLRLEALRALGLQDQGPWAEWADAYLLARERGGQPCGSGGAGCGK